MSEQQQQQQPQPQQPQPPDEDTYTDNQSLVVSVVSDFLAGGVWRDLSVVTFPIYVLEERSLLEGLCDTVAHPQWIDRATTQDDKLERFLTIIKFYLSMFHTRRPGVKKPYNPMLGEVFRAKKNLPDGSVVAVVNEQVSVSPRIIASHITNKQNQWTLSSTVWTKSQFSFYNILLTANMKGGSELRLLSRNETYRYTYPNVECSGLVRPPLRLEIVGETELTCDNSNYRASFRFLKGGGGSGYQRVEATVFDGAAAVADIKGTWDHVFNITMADDQQEREFLRVSEVETLPLIVDPVEQQSPLQSRRLWQPVTSSLLEDDLEGATREKTNLERKFGDAAKERERNGQEWQPRFFVQDDESLLSDLPTTYSYRFATNSEFTTTEEPFTPEELTPAHNNLPYID